MLARDRTVYFAGTRACAHSTSCSSSSSSSTDTSNCMRTGACTHTRARPLLSLTFTHALTRPLLSLLSLSLLLLLLSAGPVALVEGRPHASEAQARAHRLSADAESRAGENAAVPSHASPSPPASSSPPPPPDAAEARGGVTAFLSPEAEEPPAPSRSSLEDREPPSPHDGHAHHSDEADDLRVPLHAPASTPASASTPTSTSTPTPTHADVKAHATRAPALAEALPHESMSDPNVEVRATIPKAISGKGDVAAPERNSFARSFVPRFKRNRRTQGDGYAPHSHVHVSNIDPDSLPPDNPNVSVSL